MCYENDCKKKDPHYHTGELKYEECTRYGRLIRLIKDVMKDCNTNRKEQ